MRARGFAKSFGDTTVLHGVDLDLRAGEVRALVGQNGSGKSTFIKILAGFHEPDAGAELWLGESRMSLPFGRREATDVGVAFMHQDLALEPTLSVTDNFMVGSANWSAPLRPIGWRPERRRVRAALEEFGLSVDASRPISELSGPERAVVALVRALYRLGVGARGILVLDEPTAGLEREAVEGLFAAVRAARDRGCAVLFVSHNLDEIMRLCDSVTVLRDGRVVASGATAEFSEGDLISAIVGRDIGDMYPPAVPLPMAAPVALAVRGLSGDFVSDVDFDLHVGEILGVTGLAGMGQDELPSLLYGARASRSGGVTLLGQPLRLDPREALSGGMVLVPADRKSLGGDMAATVEQNLSLPVLSRYWQRGRINRAAERRDVSAVLDRFDVRPADPRRTLGQLSGGNQQKALLGKWIDLFGKAQVLLLHEPTQGVDVGARQEIFQFIRGAADRGAAILYVSTEHEDLAHLCDRVLIVRDGGIVAELHKPLEASTIVARSLSTKN